MSTSRFLFAASLCLGIVACDSTNTVSETPTAPADRSWATREATSAAASVDLEAVLDDSDLVMGDADLDIPASARSLVAGRSLETPLVTESLEGDWFVRKSTLGGWTRTDSIRVLPLDIAQRPVDDIRATEVVSRLEGPLYVQRSVLRDGDGDGYVLGNASEERLVHLEVVRTRGDLVETSRLRANSGLDGNIFQDADNQVYELSWNRLRGGDTVRTLRLSPLSGDTLLSGDGKATRLLAAEAYRKGPLAVRKVQVQVRVSGADTQIVWIEGSVAWNSGRHETFSVKDQEGGRVESGDTASLYHQIRAASGDSEVVRTFRARVLPGSGLGNEDNRVIAIDGDIEHRTGRLVRTVFHLESPEGIRGGDTPTSGSFSWIGTLRDGGTVSLVGVFTPTGVEGTWTDADGNSVVVKP